MFRVAALRGGVSSVIRTSLTNRSVLKPSLPSSLSAFRSINDAATPPLDTTLEASANIMQHSGFSQIVEPTFASLGLAHGYPSGMMQAILEVIHVHGGLPWWSTIAATTVMIRLALFPVLIRFRKKMVKLNNVTPQIQQFQKKLIEAPSGEEAKKIQKEMDQFLASKGVSLFGGFHLMFAQGIVFMSMFFGLREMANLPVESLKIGGMGWFTDLTISDPIMLLPVLTSASLFVNISIGAEGVDPNSVPPLMKKFLYWMPFLSLPVMVQFPAALNVYWLAHNLVSVGQTALMKSKAVRDYFGIEESIKWKPEDLPMNNFNMFTSNKERKTFQDRVMEEVKRQDEERQRKQKD